MMNEKKFYVEVNKLQLILDTPMTIKELLEYLNITIPVLHFVEKDIYIVEIQTSSIPSKLVDAKELMIEEDIIISTHSVRVRRYIKRMIEKLASSYKVACLECPIQNCLLRQDINKYKLQNKICESNVCKYSNCQYYIEGIKRGYFQKEENHPNLSEILKNKHLHKVAIVDDQLLEYREDIYQKGFNEVITLNLARKIKYIEEINYCLYELAQEMDEQENNLPSVVIDDIALTKEIKQLYPEFQNKISTVGTTVEIYEKLFKILGFENARFYYINKNQYNEKSNDQIIESMTFSYLMNLSNINNARINAIQEKLKMHEEVMINYNNLIKTFKEIMNMKKVLNKNIYQDIEDEIIFKKKIIKVRYTNNKNELPELINNYCADLILVGSSNNNTSCYSILKDEDVNYIYKKYFKSIGKR